MSETKTSLEKVLSIIDDKGHSVEGVTEETELKDYIDSLEQVEIILQIERDLNVQIPDDEVEDWKTIGDIVTTYTVFNKQNIK